MRILGDGLPDQPHTLEVAEIPSTPGHLPVALLPRLGERRAMDVTTIIAREVRPDAVDRYERWLAGIGDSLGQRPGHRGTTVLRPAEGSNDFVVVLQFDTTAHMQAWLDSDERRDWLERLAPLCVGHARVMPLAGLGRLATAASGGLEPPPRYKTAIMVLMGLYPVAFGMNRTLRPALGDLPEPLALLIQLSASIAVMVYLVLPVLSKALAGWLRG